MTDVEEKLSSESVVYADSEIMEEYKDICNEKTKFPGRLSREKQLRCLQASIQLVLNKALIIIATGETVQL